MIVVDLDMILFGLLAIILGPIAAYISTWVLYAFGELVESTMELRRHMVPEQKNEYKKEDSALDNLISSLKKENVKIKTYSCAFCGKKDGKLKTYIAKSTLGMEDVEYLLCESCALKNGFIKQ
ncbi:MAG: hypothetical protein IKT46_09300 [Clostridia bacterium]|nr:hypothetical protein [Clostridia bacterium]